MDRDYPLLDVIAGVPSRAAFVDDDTIRFNTYMAGDMVRLEIPYILDPPLLTNTTPDAPRMPEAHFVFLVYYIAHFISTLKEDFDKAGLMQGNAVSAMNKMITANRKRKSSAQNNMGKVQPRQGDLRKSRQALRTASGLLITG